MPGILGMEDQEGVLGAEWKEEGNCRAKSLDAALRLWQVPPNSLPQRIPESDG